MEKGKYRFTTPSSTDASEYEKTARSIREAFYDTQEENAYNIGEYMSTRKRENSFLAIISSGNPAMLDEYFAQKFPMNEPVTIGVLSDDPLQQAKYIFVSGITLATRTAMNSGLPEKLARDISDAYIRHIDKMTDADKIGAMFIHACKTFCMYIGTHRLVQMKPELRTCCEYISTHLHSPITMQDLCQATQLSAHQLTALFRAELDTTPIQYCLNQKMVYAKQLMETSDMSISQIAEIMSFPSHSNFSRRFKNTFGQKPQEYRATLGKK